MLVVCFTGVDNNNASAAVDSCEQFDGATGTWTVPSLLSLGPRAKFQGVQLLDGRILIAGAAPALLFCWSRLS